MKNTKLFQYVVTGIFIFCIVVGGILFATYRNKDTALTNIEITLWGTLPNDSFNAFVSRYFNDRDLKYTVNYIQKDANIFDQQLVEALASGVGPDAILLPENLIVRYLNKIYPIPYTVLPELTFKNTFVEEGELYLNNNGVMALPFSIDPLVMYWNRDIFNNAGITQPPANWADIYNLVLKTTQKDAAKNIIRGAVALGEFRNVNNAKEILSALFIQAGNPIISYDLDGTLISNLKDDSGVDDSTAVLALKFFTNFSNPSRAEYTWNRSLPNSLTMFTNGDLAVYLGFASEFMIIKAKNPNLNFTVAPLPQVASAKIKSTFGHMYGLAIMKNSKNPAGAYTVLTTLTSAEAVPFWKDIFNIPSARRDILQQVEQSAIKTVFNNSAIMAKGWLDPNSQASNVIFQDMVELYTTGRASVEEAVISASDKLDLLLK